MRAPLSLLLAVAGFAATSLAACARAPTALPTPSPPPTTTATAAASPSPAPTLAVTTTAPAAQTQTPQSITATPFMGPYTVVVRAEPSVPTDLGDRVLGPVTIYVTAPGATRVVVYVQPVDQPFGGQPIGEARLIGADDTPADGFAVAWAADERDPFVIVYAVAYGQPDVNYSRSSAPLTLLLDWRLRAPPTAPRTPL